MKLFASLLALLAFVVLALVFFLDWKFSDQWVLFREGYLTSKLKEERSVEYSESTKGLTFWRHIHIDNVKYACFTVPESNYVKCFMTPAVK